MKTNECNNKLSNPSQGPKIKRRQIIIVSKLISNCNRKERKRCILKNGELYKEQEPVLKESGGTSGREEKRELTEREGLSSNVPCLPTIYTHLPHSSLSYPYPLAVTRIRIRPFSIFTISFPFRFRFLPFPSLSFLYPCRRT